MKDMKQTKERLTKELSTFRHKVIRLGKVQKSDKGMERHQKAATDRRKIEDDLCATRGRLRILLSSSPAVLYMSKISGNYGTTFISENVKAQIGYESNDFLDNPGFWANHIHPDDAPRVYEELKHVFEHDSHVYEYRFKHKDGHYIWLRDERWLVRDTDGNPQEIVGYWIDITDRKQAEEKIREAEEKYRSIVENSDDQIFMLDKDYKFLFINKSAANLSGKSAQKMFGMSIFETLPKTTAIQFGENIKKVFETGKNISLDEKMLIQGREYYNSTKLNPIKDDSGRVIAVAGIVRDITRRKQAEEALRKSEGQLSNAMKIANLGHWELDVTSGMFTFTDSFYAIFRTTAQEMGGYHMSIADYAKRFVHPEDAPLVAEETRKAVETDDPNFNRYIEHRMLYADGSVGHIGVRFFIVKDENGKTIKTYGVNQDITERKLAEEKIKTSLREKDILLKEIHHRVRNNLQIISSLLNLQASKIDDENLTAIFSTSRSRIQSMAMVHEMMYTNEDFARINMNYYLNNLITSLIKLFNPDMNRIQIRLKNEDIYLDLNRAIPCGMIMNELATNAIKHAFPGDRKGFIEIRSRKDSDSIRLSVRDDGVSLPPDFKPSEVHSLGMTIITDLTHQIDGELKLIQKDRIKTFELILPIDKVNNNEDCQ